VGTSIALNDKMKADVEHIKSDMFLSSNREVLEYLIKNYKGEPLAKQEPKQEPLREPPKEEQKHLTDEEIEQAYNDLWKHAITCPNCITILDKTAQAHGFELLDLTGKFNNV
jgi:hypothetical protein